MTSKEYLAAKYMSIDKITSSGLSSKISKGIKVKKKKGKSSAVSASKSHSTFIIDENDDWTSKRSDDEEDAPVMVNDIPEETKFKSNSWTVITEGAGPSESFNDLPPSQEDLEDEELVRQAVYAAGGGEEWELQKEKQLREAEEERLFKKRKASARRTPSPSPSVDEDRTTKRRTPSPTPSEESVSGPRKKRRTPSLSPSPSPPPRENKRLQAEDLGRDAKTIYRDRHGRIVDMEKVAAQTEAKMERFEQDKADQLKYKAGVAQEKMREAAMRRLQEETHAPLAVYKDNREHNEKLKEIDRWGDPMSGLTSSKTKKGDKPRYKGPPGPPNRFGIEPGYRWDGVDRGNGFETKFFQAKYARQTLSEEAYKWSSEDM
jgi:pre-mRNA-splicing factor CWC26